MLALSRAVEIRSVCGAPACFVIYTVVCCSTYQICTAVFILIRGFTFFEWDWCGKVARYHRFLYSRLLTNPALYSQCVSLLQNEWMHFQSISYDISVDTVFSIL